MELVNKDALALKTVRIVKLLTMDLVVASLEDIGSLNPLDVVDPFVIVTNNVQGKMHLGFQPYAAYADQSIRNYKITICEAQFLSYYEPEDRFKQIFLDFLEKHRVAANGLIAPRSKILS